MLPTFLAEWEECRAGRKSSSGNEIKAQLYKPVIHKLFDIVKLLIFYWLPSSRSSLCKKHRTPLNFREKVNYQIVSIKLSDGNLEHLIR